MSFSSGERGGGRRYIPPGEESGVPQKPRGGGGSRGWGVIEHDNEIVLNKPDKEASSEDERMIQDLYRELERSTQDSLATRLINDPELQETPEVVREIRGNMELINQYYTRYLEESNIHPEIYGPKADDVQGYIETLRMNLRGDSGRGVAGLHWSTSFEYSEVFMNVYEGLEHQEKMFYIIGGMGHEQHHALALVRFDFELLKKVHKEQGITERSLWSAVKSMGLRYNERDNSGKIIRWGGTALEEGLTTEKEKDVRNEVGRKYPLALKRHRDCVAGVIRDNQSIDYEGGIYIADGIDKKDDVKNNAVFGYVREVRLYNLVAERFARATMRGGAPTFENLAQRARIMSEHEPLWAAAGEVLGPGLADRVKFARAGDECVPVIKELEHL